jgi:hypothetical protein
MLILNFDKFAALPAGAIFSFYEPAVCQGLYRKEDTLFRDTGEPRDFFLESLVPNCWNGEHPSIGEGTFRWGAYDFDQLFAVFEEEDLKCLRELAGLEPDAAPRRPLFHRLLIVYRQHREEKRRAAFEVQSLRNQLSAATSRAERLQEQLDRVACAYVDRSYDEKGHRLTFSVSVEPRPGKMSEVLALAAEALHCKLSKELAKRG